MMGLTMTQALCNKYIIPIKGFQLPFIERKILFKCLAIVESFFSSDALLIRSSIRRLRVAVTFLQTCGISFFFFGFWKFRTTKECSIVLTQWVVFVFSKGCLYDNYRQFFQVNFQKVLTDYGMFDQSIKFLEAERTFEG